MIEIIPNSYTTQSGYFLFTPNGVFDHVTRLYSNAKWVMQKIVRDTPHKILLVLDGSTGQNAYEQAKQFSKTTKIDPLAITKLDGTAKGGVVIGISDQLKVPVKYIGIGEKLTTYRYLIKANLLIPYFNSCNYNNC